MSIGGGSGRIVGQTSAKRGPGHQARLIREAVESTERIDEVGEPQPSKPVLLAVLDARDHGLVDPRQHLEIALAPAEAMPARPDHPTDEVPAVLPLRVALWLIATPCPDHIVGRSSGDYARLTRP